MTDPDGPQIPADGHAGDLVSARLDGELDEATAAWVDEHLDSCVACAEVAGAVGVAREWMRSAPAVDASPVVGSVIARRRRMIGNGLVFVGLVLFVLGLLAITSSVTHPTVAPDVDAFVAAHERSSHAESGDMRPVDDVPSIYATPVVLGAMPSPLERRAVYDGMDLTVAVYEDDAERVTVYQQPGRLDWESLPSGDRVQVAGRPAWVREGQPVVVVAEVGDLTVTLVADDVAQAERAVADLGAPTRTSTLDRVHDSCQRLLEVFALAG